MDLKKRIQDSLEIKRAILQDEDLLQSVDLSIALVTDCFRRGSKVLWCGNGGSAADSQHLSSELSGRFLLDRPALNSEALHVNGSYITAVANDYGYENIYARALEAKGKPDDILIVLTTSGTSNNVIRALKKAKEIGMKTIALTGSEGLLDDLQTDILMAIPSKSTPRIQECHMLIGHIICEGVEADLFQS